MSKKSDQGFEDQLKSAREKLLPVLEELERHFMGQTLDDGEKVLAEVAEKLAGLGQTFPVSLDTAWRKSMVKSYLVVAETVLGNVRTGAYKILVYAHVNYARTKYYQSDDRPPLNLFAYINPVANQ